MILHVFKIRVFMIELIFIPRQICCRARDAKAKVILLKKKYITTKSNQSVYNFNPLLWAVFKIRLQTIKKQDDY